MTRPYTGVQLEGYGLIFRALKTWIVMVNTKKEAKVMTRLTMKEALVFGIAYFNRLDKNGELKNTMMNKARYKVSCWIAGGRNELDRMIVDIYGKLKEQGFDV